MQISERLNLVADFVPACQTAADIGTDHGYIPIELIKRKTVQYAYAMDINRGPLERAKEHIEAENMSDRIQIRQSDGLKELKPGEAQTIIIAGMGGALTVRILENGKETADQAQTLVLSPHSEIELVRKYLIQNGYEIVREKMILDHEKYYTVMKAEKAENPDEVRKQYQDEICYLYGKKLIEEADDTLYRYLKEKREKFRNISAHLETQQGDGASRRKAEVEREILEMERALSMMEREKTGGKEDA